MPQDQKTPSSKPSNNEYLQPLAIASLAAIFGFVFVYYYRGDVTLALTVGGVAFLILFWVVLRGNNLKKRRESKASLPASTDISEASNVLGFWPRVSIACSLLLLGLPIAIHYAVGTASDPAKTNRSLRSEQDDKVKRVRKVEFILWKELSSPSQSFADQVDAAAAALEIPVHSVEKNWPGGPIVVTYDGTANDALEIHWAIRAVGVPTHAWRIVK